MDGFEIGVRHYNEVHGTSMKLVGWSQAEQNGLFVGSFDDQLAAKTLTEGLLDQNVDVIMPVAAALCSGHPLKRSATAAPTPPSSA